MRIKAAVLYKERTPLVVEEVELDPPEAGEVLLKMAASGICHTDVHRYTGDRPGNLPIVLGHEGSGIVESIGEGVTSVGPGDHVVPTFLPRCGKCRWCMVGRPNLCDLGAHIRSGKMLDGTTRLHSASDGADLHNFLFTSTFAEYAVVPEASLVQVPASAKLERICLLGCGFTTAFTAATRKLGIQAGETVTVVGCGGLGLAAIQGLALSGARKIIAVDLHEEKLAMARKFGATDTIVNRHNVEQVVAEIHDMTEGLGTDYAMELVGYDQSDETLAIAFQATRKGGTMCMVGVAAENKRTLPIDPAAVTLYSKTIMGTVFGDSQFHVDIPRYVDMYQQGKINLDDMVTQELTLEQINTGFENVLAGNRVARQVIRFF